MENAYRKVEVDEAFRQSKRVAPRAPREKQRLAYQPHMWQCNSPCISNSRSRVDSAPPTAIRFNNYLPAHRSRFSRAPPKISALSQY
jgi:hypothetical protein